MRQELGEAFLKHPWEGKRLVVDEVVDQFVVKALLRDQGIRIFPHKSITSRPPETRMGKGKGAVEGWVAVIRPGNILFEVGGVPESAAKEAMRLASYKLAIRTRLVVRNPHA